MGLNELSRARARLGSSSAHRVFMKVGLELGLVRAYLFELGLGSRIKPKVRLGSARAILRTTSNQLKAWLELASILLNGAKARLANGIIIIIILYIKKNCLGSFSGSITKRALFKAQAQARLVQAFSRAGHE
ncbi:hypothetical protein HanHA300_Chr06g0199191 [Helianthus annuus]|nr:hypothetical protein HanHA300_Chr06g0199191 [Helianthus annuus]KAJ0572272.1 hypothetical protein HanHA89_Chr06g0213961 [Helianthus annuus]KAJ0736727.1 hypothetical protein HanLR1_Chr06g0199131 [Helianthus annuus]KAJ0739664.1 hypothetical protein HanOQP8_Chr06g0208251 [Helianthus annuus]